jgi:hypothetical protein
MLSKDVLLIHGCGVFAGLFVFRALLALGVLADPFLLRIAAKGNSSTCSKIKFFSFPKDANRN